MKWNSNLYDSKHAFVSKFGEELVDLLDPKPGESVLDLGCGTGDLAAQIAGSGARVIGIDNSESMIWQARKKYPSLDFRVLSADAFSLNQKFDAVFSNATLHWVLKYEASAKCMYDSLKSGGRLVAEFGGKGNVEQVVAALRTQLGLRGYDMAARRQPWYFPSTEEYRAVLERVGFRVTEIRLFDRPTELHGDQGLQNWLRMFGGLFLEGIPESDIQQILSGVEDQLRPSHFEKGIWRADYRRLRVLAVKK